MERRLAAPVCIRGVCAFWNLKEEEVTNCSTWSTIEKVHIHT